MAEEFADFIGRLNQESIEDQLSELKNIMSILVNIVEKAIKNYEMEFSAIHNKIIKLETKQMKSKLPKIEVLSIPPSPPPSQQRPIIIGDVKSDIMVELKELFRNRKENAKK